MWIFPTLLCMTSLVPLRAFNVDVNHTWVISEGIPHILSSFLHQDPSTNQISLLLTSYRTNKTTKLLHQCSLQNDGFHCQSVEHGHMPKGRHRGVTLVQSHQGVLMCVQTLIPRPHSVISELTGTCSLLAPDLSLRRQFNFSEARVKESLNHSAHLDADIWPRNKRSSTESRARQRRTLKEADEEEGEEDAGTEIAIVLDGSGSISPSDFQIAKDFISSMMKNFTEKCFECNFALVQYGSVIQTEFDLQDSQDVTATLNKIQNITQVMSVTKTASAMQHVLDNIFIEERGSKKKASKFMVVITDGDIFMDPLNLTTVINSPKMEGVERFAIGVGEAFTNEKTDRELKLIASHPSETHAFKVDNYRALDGLLGKLQQNIIRMEGTVGDALHYQLAQIGFSAQILEEGKVLLGAVGAFDWSGGVLLYDMDNQMGLFLNQTEAEAQASPYSYLGYDVVVLHKACRVSYVAGAPRHKHQGAVFELQKESRGTNFMPVLEGEQMGSYFGSELCPVDSDMDGTTDLLLVAAPFYHVRGEEGRVYVYRLNEDGSFSLTHTLSGYPEYSNARFGFAMATVGDISQDNLTDVAIGAPLEDCELEDNLSCGSVYIYNGRKRDLSASPSQRIRASMVAQRLRYFGMSLDGGLDITRDGLVDITVGALDQAVVLCSRPVVLLKASMTFTPQALPIGFNSNVNVDLCFEVSFATTAAKSDLRKTFLNLMLDADVLKQRKRWQFSEKRISLKFNEWSSDPRLCQSFHLIPTEAELCEEDCFSNITISVSYQLHTLEGMRDHPQPVLDLYTEPTAIFQLPYEKDCKNKLFCIAELHLSTTISREDFVVGITPRDPQDHELVMNISLGNSGEDSYMTSMTLNYPRNLQLKKIQKPPSPNIQCADPKPNASSLVMICKISHPILKKASANISVVWQLEENVFPNSTDITVTVTNSNEGRSLVKKTRSLQIKRGFVAVLPKPSVMYMNTSQGLSDSKEFFFSIHGENRFGIEFQLHICVPTKIQGYQIVNVKSVSSTQNSTNCEEVQKHTCERHAVQYVENWNSRKCTITSAKENVTVSAELSLSGAKQLLTNVTELQIFGEISFNNILYEGLNTENHRTTVTVIFLKKEAYLSLPLIIASSIGGLLVLIVIIIILFKCGFFKRKYQEQNSIRKAQLESENLLNRKD